ncbi:MAG: family 4 glycosyl hydrolase [Anaerolineae bacterium]
MVKLAYIGGGSLFVPSILNGAAQVMRSSPQPYELEVCLYDIKRDKAEPMAAYGALFQRAWGVPLSVTNAQSQAEALEGADAVIVSVWLGDEHERISQLQHNLGFELAEEGPQVAAWAAACAPWSLSVAADMRVYCPQALLISVMNPTDVLAGVLTEAGGIRAAGMCVEVDGLRGALAYYFKVAADSIVLNHAGVNHDGWVLGFTVDGRDGYELWRYRWPEIENDPDFHPGNRIINQILNLTGHLKSSGYHMWPYQVEQTVAQKDLWVRWPDKRRMYYQAVQEAIQNGQPIQDKSHIHPERSLLNYPYTGLTVGKLLQSIATGAAHIIALQRINQGSVTNFPNNGVVEVPTLVQGKTVRPLPMGELPEWLGGYTRLLAIQRRLFIDYLLERRLSTLKHALAVLPMFGTSQQLNALAEGIHERLR